jgi:hypothetical protein
MKNSLIDLLAAYGPVPNGKAIYDELVLDAARKAGHAPIAIPEDTSALVASHVRADPPLSVILTGTAGDGKTYAARMAFQALAPDREWGDDVEQTIVVDGRTITFVKDLSELTAAQKAALAPRLLDELVDGVRRETFVLCANDGHLLRSWRGSADPRSGRIENILAVMLRDDRSEPPDDLPFRLLNLSRRSRADALDDVVEAMLEHPGWGDCTQHCPGLGAAAPCPIRLNREILLADGPDSLRSRLRNLIEIAAADDDHLSLRQVMILVVNALLGDRKVPQTPLLNCSRAQVRAANREYEHTNPFANVLGENHPPSVRERIAAFATLSRYGVGEETNNRFDEALLDPDPVEVLPDHPQYGLRLIAAARRSYIERPSEVIATLRPMLRDQRRRLFFTVPDDGRRLDGPWSLTLVHSGATYVDLLRSTGSSSVEAEACRLILRGLNRALTGSLTDTDDALWLTQPSGVFMGREVPLMANPPIGWSGYGPALTLVRPTQPGRPPALEVQMPGLPAPLAGLCLTPALFEYLARVAHGALPTSFSNECLQEIRSFQIRVAGAFEELNRQSRRPPVMALIETGEDQLQSRPIGLVSNPVLP